MIGTKKVLVWSAALITLAIGALLFVKHRYVLDSDKLESAIKSELPPGTPKQEVMQFVQSKKPVFCDDLGTHLNARLTGRAENLIYRKDIILDFEFDSSGKLLSFSKKVYLSFI